MAGTKVAIKSEELTSFGGIFMVMEQFDRILSPVIDSNLGSRGNSFAYRYSDIIRSLMSVYFCGGTCVEDISSNLRSSLALHPNLRTCSADTILRAISELTVGNTTYASEQGKSYDFNTADSLNTLLVKALCATSCLKSGCSYDLDFDHQFIEAEKYDAKCTYKKFLGYRAGVAVIGDMVVGVENSDGNVNVRFRQSDTLERIFKRLEGEGIGINRFRADCGSCSEEIVDTVSEHCKQFYIRANNCSALYDRMSELTDWSRECINFIDFELTSITVEKWEGKEYRLVVQRQKRTDGTADLWEGGYTYRCILTNDRTSTDREVVEFYNQRGGKERVFDDLNNGFGWNRLPKSFMAENTVFLLLTALIHNFYKIIMQRLDVGGFGLKRTSRIKAFVFKFISVPAKWIKMARYHILNIYSTNQAYATAFIQPTG